MSSEVPDGWTSAKLSDLTRETRQRNGSLLARERLYGVSNTRGLEPMRAHVMGKSVERCRVVRRGDLAYNPMRLDVGSIAQWRGDDPVLVSPDYITFRARTQRLDTQYLRFLTQSILWQSQVAEHGTGSVRVRLYYRDIGRFTFHIPPIAEQAKIASVLAAVEEAVDAQELLIEQSQQVKAGLLQGLFANSPYPTAHIADVGHSQLGQQRHPKFASGDNVRPYLRVANVLDGRIDFADLNEMHFPQGDLPKFELVPGDILLNEGQSTHLVGRSAVYRGEVPGLCVQKTLLRYRCGPRLLPDFAHAVFQHWLWSGHFAEIAVQTTSMAHLTGVRFDKMKVPVPSLDEQRSIIAMTRSINGVLDLAQGQVETLSRLKAGLLQDLLTGKVRVKP